MNLEGSVALVTGANRGLGAVYAQALLDRGAAKVYAAVRDVSSVSDHRLTPLRLDVTDRASIDAAAEAAPDVTLLINNAGVDTHTATLGDEAGLHTEMEVNYFGPIAVSRAFAPVLGANGGGALINMLSGLSWFTLPNSGGYSSAKAALWMATNSRRICWSRGRWSPRCTSATWTPTWPRGSTGRRHLPRPWPRLPLTGSRRASTRCSSTTGRGMSAPVCQAR
jgi:NAD(P)-dependent dehydrogenase (short-subunit alcohol dehydrogenase family)